MLLAWRILPLSMGILFVVCSVTQTCLTLCDCMDCNMPGLTVYHHLPKFAQLHVRYISDAIQPAHPWTCSSSSALNLSQHQGVPGKEPLFDTWFPRSALELLVPWINSVLPSHTVDSLLTAVSHFIDNSRCSRFKPFCLSNAALFNYLWYFLQSFTPSGTLGISVLAF